MQNREKQIEELTNELIFTNNYGTLGAVAKHLYEKGYRKQSEDVTDINVGNKSEWISVDERLPDREGKYLVCTTNGNIGVGRFIDYYGKGTHLCFDCWAVTHWMPLPEAPKMKGGAE